MLHLPLVIVVGLAGAPALAAPTVAAPPGVPTPLLVARERGSRSHHGSGHRQGRRDRSGFSGQHAHLDRGHRRPTGGWSSRIGDRDRARRDFDRRNLERRGRRWLDDGLADIDRDRVRRSFDRAERQWDHARREVRNLAIDDLHLDRRVDRARHLDDDWPGWVRPGWALARPWRTGWYLSLIHI